MKLELLLICLSLFFMNMNLLAQDSTEQAAKLDSIEEKFPDAWVGEWVGELKVHNAKGLQNTLHMELHLLPLENSDSFSWKIFYGEDEDGERPYELVPVKPEYGVYLIDEKNAIKMECFVLDNKVYQVYDVEGTLIYITLRKQGDRLEWELVAGPLKPYSVTGDTIINEEEIPEVKTFPVGTLQHAILYRKK